VALLTRQIGRRMLNRDVSLAFAAWIEQWEAKTYAFMRLRQVAGRLRVPELASAYAFWVEYTLARQAAAEKAAMLAASRSLEGQLRAAHNETNQLTMVKLKHEDEIRALLEKLHGLTQVSEERDLTIQDQTPIIEALQLEVSELREIARQSQEEATQAGLKKAEAEADHAANAISSRELLERLLAEQRLAFDAEHAEVRGSVQQAVGQRKAVEEELKRSKAQISSDSIKLRQAERTEAEMGGIKQRLGEARTEASELRDQVMVLQRELAKKPPAPPPKSKEVKPPPQSRQGLLGGLDLDEGDDAPPIGDQIATALRSNAGRVMDLLREWDVDGDGEISRKEFHAAMPKLGLEVPKAGIDELFDSWDADGGGCLTFKELQKILRAKPPSVDKSTSKWKGGKK